MAKFRIRNLLGKVPFLDGLRLSFLAGFCHHGIDFVDNSYPTMRVQSPETKALLDSGQEVIFAAHHGRSAGLLRLRPTKKPLSILISQSRDGEIISRACAAVGFSIARGSEKRGAVQGAMQMVKAADKGQHLVILVDGPRGPQHSVKNGILKMAQLTQMPIVPVAFSSATAEYFWGWDSFMVPHWGSPVLHVLGNPIFVNDKLSEDELESKRDELEQVLKRLALCADQYWHPTTNTIMAHS